MTQNNSSMNFSKSILALLVLVVITQSYDLKFCPSNSFEKRNALVEEVVALPNDLSYVYSSTFSYLDTINELSVRTEDTKVLLSVVYKDYSIVQQYKSYITPI